MQSKLSSLVEQLFNVGSGVIIAMGVGQVVYPILGYNVSVHDNFIITVVFTTISIVRGYIWRRLFDRLS